MVPAASLIRSRCVAKAINKDLGWRVLQQSLTIKNYSTIVPKLSTLVDCEEPGCSSGKVILKKILEKLFAGNKLCF